MTMVPIPGLTRALIVVAAVALTAAACAGSATPGAVGQDAPLGAWQLRTATPTIDVPPPGQITLTVDERDGALRAGGTAACNSYGGRLDAGGGSWRLLEMAVTEMGCEQPLMTAESTYLRALQDIDSWAVDDGVLTLTGGTTELVYDLLPPVEPAALTGTTWVLDGVVRGAGPDGAVSSTMAGVEPAELQLDEDGTFTLFTGCRDFAGEWTTSGDLMVRPSFGEAEGSRGIGDDGGLACNDAAEQQEQTVLGVIEGEFTPDTTERRLTIMRGDEGLTFRAAG